MLHSGSRGVGNRIGTTFIELARKDMDRLDRRLPNRDLAYFEEGSEHFAAYMEAVEWAQVYARTNRDLMMDRVVAVTDAALDARYPRAWPSWVRVVVRGRPPLEARVEHPRGDPENFPTDAELDGKFRGLAARALSPAAIDRLEGALESFPRTTSARPLLAATVPTVT